jgi:hypothetical protein
MRRAGEAEIDTQASHAQPYRLRESVDDARPDEREQHDGRISARPHTSEVAVVRAGESGAVAARPKEQPPQSAPALLLGAETSSADLARRCGLIPRADARGQTVL